MPCVARHSVWDGTCPEFFSRQSCFAMEGEAGSFWGSLAMAGVLMTLSPESSMPTRDHPGPCVCCLLGMLAAAQV